MSKKNKSGVTLIILAVTIIVALALLSTIVISYDSIKNSMKKREFAKEIYTIQKLSDEYYFKNNQLAVGDSYSLNLNNESSTDYISQFQDEDSISNVYTDFYELDLYKIGVENVARGTKKDEASDVYIVSSKTHKVFYAKGDLIGGYTYYTLTPELKKMLE